MQKKFPWSRFASKNERESEKQRSSKKDMVDVVYKAIKQRTLMDGAAKPYNNSNSSSTVEQKKTGNNYSFSKAGKTEHDPQSAPFGVDDRKNSSNSGESTQAVNYIQNPKKQSSTEWAISVNSFAVESNFGKYNTVDGKNNHGVDAIETDLKTSSAPPDVQGLKRTKNDHTTGTDVGCRPYSELLEFGCTKKDDVKNLNTNKEVEVSGHQKADLIEEIVDDDDAYEMAVMVPPAFICRLSKRIMKDPVMVASGISFERESIQAWFDEGQTSCPVTKKPLFHLRLTPDTTLKSRISEWMASHVDNVDNLDKTDTNVSSVPLPKLLKDLQYDSVSSTSLRSNDSRCLQTAPMNDSFSSSSASSYSRITIPECFRNLNESFISSLGNSDCSSCWEPDKHLFSFESLPSSQESSFKSVQEGKENKHPVSKLHPKSHSVELKENLYIATQIGALVFGLQSEHIEVQRSCVSEVRLLAKHDDDKRMLIYNAGGLEPLVTLLRSADETIQQEATTALYNLSLNETIKAESVKFGAIDALVDVLKGGLSSIAVGNAAIALTNLAVGEENLAKVGAGGVITPLLELLSCGSTRGKKDAATALYRLSSIEENKRRMVRGGATRLLLNFIGDVDSTEGMADKAIAILASIVGVEEARVAFVEEGGVKVLIEVLNSGSRKSRELAINILFQLCIHSKKHKSLVRHMDLVPTLLELHKTGNTRLKTKIGEFMRVLKDQKQPCLVGI